MKKSKKETWFARLVKWFNGKKTIIGAIAMATIGYLQVQSYINNNTAIYLGTLATIIFGIGVSHKIVKANKK